MYNASPSEIKKKLCTIHNINIPKYVHVFETMINGRTRFPRLFYSHIGEQELTELNDGK